MSRMFDVRYCTTVEADDPREACRKARDELRVRLDSDAPLGFDWVAYDDGSMTARAYSTLMPDDEIATSTEAKVVHRRAVRT